MKIKNVKFNGIRITFNASVWLLPILFYIPIPLHLFLCLFVNKIVKASREPKQYLLFRRALFVRA